MVWKHGAHCNINWQRLIAKQNITKIQNEMQKRNKTNRKTMEHVSNTLADVLFLESRNKLAWYFFYNLIFRYTYGQHGSHSCRWDAPNCPTVSHVYIYFFARMTWTFSTILWHEDFTAPSRMCTSIASSHSILYFSLSICALSSTKIYNLSTTIFAFSNSLCSRTLK